jgi:hypothetical protein
MTPTTAPQTALPTAVQTAPRHPRQALDHGCSVAYSRPPLFVGVVTILPRWRRRVGTGLLRDGNPPGAPLGIRQRNPIPSGIPLGKPGSFFGIPYGRLGGLPGWRSCPVARWGYFCPPCFLGIVNGVRLNWVGIFLLSACAANICFGVAILDQAPCPPIEARCRIS